MDIDSSILEMRKQPHLSASSIKAYLDCGLYYKFSRVDKMQRTHTSDNLLFGSTIHRVLADYNQEKIIGNHMGLEDLTQLFEKYWKEAVLNNTDNILYSKGKSYESLLEQGKKLIKTYMSEAPRDQYEIMAVEEPFAFTIDGIDMPIIGVMDIVERDGTIQLSSAIIKQLELQLPLTRLTVISNLQFITWLLNLMVMQIVR